MIRMRRGVCNQADESFTSDILNQMDNTRFHPDGDDADGVHDDDVDDVDDGVDGGVRQNKPDPGCNAYTPSRQCITFLPFGPEITGACNTR